MHIIIKDGPKRGESRESALYRRITSGTISNEDIELAVNSGDRTLKQAMEKRMNKGFRVKKELDDEFGKGSFDYRDSKGNPVKETEIISGEEMGKPSEREMTEEKREEQRYYATQRRAGVAPENIKPQSPREMFPWAFPRSTNA